MVSSGTFISESGLQYPYRSEYWGDSCTYVGGVASAKGLHDYYLDAYWRVQMADTPEALLSTVTTSSRNVFGGDAAVARMAASNKELNARKSANQRRATLIPEQFYFSVSCTDPDGTQHVFLAVTRGTLRPLTEVKPPFDIQAITQEDGKWKLDLRQHSHPVLQDMKAGAWKQLGAPHDIGDPAAYKEDVARALKRFEEAATRPAKRKQPPATRQAKLR
jgi:hypothetical protein